VDFEGEHVDVLSSDIVVGTAVGDGSDDGELVVLVVHQVKSLSERNVETFGSLSNEDTSSLVAIGDVDVVNVLSGVGSIVGDGLLSSVVEGDGEHAVLGSELLDPGGLALLGDRQLVRV